MFLDLEEDHFDKFVQKGNSILRPIHYPPIKTKPLGAERAAAHGDINLITCLLYTSPSPRDKRQSRMPSSA